MKHYGKVLMAMGFLALTACQSASKPETAAASQDAESDRCGASQYQSYVGKPLSSLNSQRFEHPVRAIPWNAAVTMDFNLNRLNFMADKSGNISRVYCG
ncbi:I78 family peptidase inhibitor [Pantoea sp. LMR881]|uniref:I78 family peptidase inhibitor n=1 Tax=Pantoea sp. LMR881 TaxID=3014336 RepID=UPI0022AFD5D3|nr:I78 family peptidase inhibitor [Pantoea sp. LMR881]MCZ4059150.1 I78 family peptidase inhibitor [Pantoea sp. LMR881]